VRRASIHDLAAYIMREQGSMSPWRLHKLVYYSQAWALVWDDKPLFRARIEAWAGGPAVPALYKRHRGKFSIDKWSGEPSRLAPRQETIDAVITPYGKLTGWQLEQIVKTGRPWLEARKGLRTSERGHREIMLESMQTYYEAVDADENALLVADIDWPSNEI
jgi:uncharacterized phage-associated protein